MRQLVRPDIQALRAFAIISVIVFHLWPTSFGGGFVGVDIFFVISGFLITGALWREVESSDRIGFAAFWSRRARRLLPASLLVILVTSVVALVVGEPIGFLSFSDDAFSSTLYVENFSLLGRQTDYLASAGQVSPFQHFWSLSVEEQFYLVWPILMFLGLITARARKAVRKRSMVTWLVAIAAGSFAYNIWQTNSLASVAYFSTFARAWEFAVGGLVAVWLGRSREVEAQRRPWWFAFGALAMFYSATMFDSHTVFPGFAALIPVLGAAAVIYAGQSVHHMMPRGFIALKPWQFLGDISYSLYLWHWPLIVLVPLWLGKPLSNTGKLGVFAVAILLAWLTKRFLEDAVRFGLLSRLAAKWQILVAIVAMLVTLAASMGLVSYARSLAEKSWANTHLHPSLLQLRNDWSSIEKNSKCLVSPTETDFKVCVKGDPLGNKTVSLIGDSHTRQIFDAVNSIAIARHYKLMVISKSHCEPMASKIYPADYSEPSCLGWNQQLEAYLAKTPKIDLVVNMNASNYSILSKGASAAFKALVQTQLERGTKWLVIKDNPVPIKNLTACLELFGTSAEFDCAVTTKVGFKHADHLAEVIKELPGVIYADFSDVICKPALCPPFIGSDIVYRDTNHLSRTFSEKYMQPRLDALLSKELSE